MAKKQKSRTPLTFSDLEKLQQTARTPCGRTAYSKSAAGKAAHVRNILKAKSETWSIQPCYAGCGRDIFHLTTQRVKGKKGQALNPAKATRTLAQQMKKNRKKTKWERNRQMYHVMSVGTWEDDGGALHPRDLEG